MYGAQSTDEEPERTAFRLAEKHYKLYKSLPPKIRKKPVLNQTDLFDVVDFHAILESVVPVDGIFRLDCPGFDRPVFCFRDRPGFYFIPRALTIEEQCYWIRQSLVSFPQPPNRTSLTAIYGPISDLFAAVQNKKILVEAENSVLSLGDDKIHSGNYIFSESNANTCVEAQGSFKSVSASTLLRKLRWGTLGLQFNWSKVSDQSSDLELQVKRNYDFTLPHNKIPEKLCQLAKEMAVPAMPSGEEFQPEAAIVNYFGPSDMLGGHLDDMEADWSKPIVSISLGCKAIFLLGGTSREDIPISMFLRSGDIVLMAGKARECFHGVPRIFTDDKHAEVSVLLSQFSGEEDRCITDYIKNSRININIRQRLVGNMCFPPIKTWNLYLYSLLREQKGRESGVWNMPGTQRGNNSVHLYSAVLAQFTNLLRKLRIC